MHTDLNILQITVKLTFPDQLHVRLGGMTVFNWVGTESIKGGWVGR